MSQSGDGARKDGAALLAQVPAGLPAVLVARVLVHADIHVAILRRLGAVEAEDLPEAAQVHPYLVHHLLCLGRARHLQRQVIQCFVRG